MQEASGSPEGHPPLNLAPSWLEGQGAGRRGTLKVNLTTAVKSSRLYSRKDALVPDLWLRKTWRNRLTDPTMSRRVLVLDNGAGLCKAGWTTDAAPQLVSVLWLKISSPWNC